MNRPFPEVAATAAVLRQQRHAERPTAAQRTAESVRPLLTELITHRTNAKLRELRVSRERGAVWFHEVWHAIRSSGEEIHSCFETAVRSNIIVAVRDEDLRADMEEYAWRDVRGTIPPLVVPSIEAPSSSSWEMEIPLADETRVWDAYGGIPALARKQMTAALATCVEALVRDGHLGYVLYRDGERAAYSYVLRQVRVPGVSTSERVDCIADDPSAPTGRRKTYARTRRWEGEVVRVAEEHVHHLRGVHEGPLQAFRGAVPRRVEVLRSILPEWFTPALRVMHGIIIQEEVYERDEGTMRILSERIVHMWKDSPAVQCGDLVLTGWSSDDLAGEQSRWSDLGKKVLVAAGLIAASLFVPPAFRWIIRAFRGGL